MKIDSPYWSVRFTKAFHKSFLNLSPRNIWRVDGFIRNIVYIEKPTDVYEHTPCVNCPPNFFLFGLSDDGLGNKGIEIQLWLQEKERTIWFLKCGLAKKP